MKNLLFIKICSCIIFIAVTTGCQKNESVGKDLEDEKLSLLSRVEDFNAAFKTCSIEELESMLTENYRHTNGSSKSIDKATWINYLKSRKDQIEKGELLVNAYEMKETEVDLYNDTAILTAKILVSSRKLGEAQNNEYRVTNIWIKDNDIWKRAGFHDGKIQ